jgi:hypothetical protein
VPEHSRKSAALAHLPWWALIEGEDALYYVADWVPGAGRVHGFAPDGHLLGTWWAGDDGQRLRSPQGMAVDAQGRLHVADRNLPGLVTITSEAGRE